jgi:glucose-1-phosphate thymidylyltransferase
MKGVILAGGTGSRLFPLTKVVNKHLLPIYNQPMIFFPLRTLEKAGVKDVIIVTTPDSDKQFQDLLEDAPFELNISFVVQETPGGIAEALSLTKDFIGKDKVAMVLGDNIIEDNLAEVFKKFEQENYKAMVMLKEVADARPYGVASVCDDGFIENIEEKPLNPLSNLAVIGCYLYDNSVFSIIDKQNPSDRGELEITDVNNAYILEHELHYHILKGYWRDCGESFESLNEAILHVRNRENARKNGTLTSEKAKKLVYNG